MSNVESESGSQSDEPQRVEQVVEGIGVAPGIAVGVVHRLEIATPETARTHVDADAVDDELALFSDALDRAEQEIEQVRSMARHRLDTEEEAIFEAQELMLHDDQVLDAVRERIRDNRQSAAYAVTEVLRDHRRRLERSDDEYLRERVDDIMELETRLLRSLQRGKTAATIQPNSIVVADRLAAADLIRFHRHGMLGCVTARGGETSHVSIIARGLNLPAVVGAEHVLEEVSNHAPVILDGRRGHLVVHPNAETLARYREQRARRQARVEAEEDREGGAVFTSDRRRISLRANVDFGETLETLDRYGAEGIGLMRTEVLFLSGREESLHEDTQESVYQTAAEVSEPHGATIRLLDLGGDKMLPFAEEEENPFLGWRGIRVLLDRADELLRPQIRALLRASQHGSLRVLLPMVTHLDELHRVRTIIEEEAQRLGDKDPSPSNLELGVLIEVPAAALQARRFAEEADFLSIGTNDLTQYVLAVDRGNDRVADRYDALHPAVLELIKQTIAAGQAANTPVTLCGEMGSDVRALPILLGLGLRSLSVSPPYLPTVRHVVSNTTFEEARALADDVLAASDAGTVRRRARTWCDEHYDSDLFVSSEELRASEDVA